MSAQRQVTFELTVPKHGDTVICVRTHQMPAMDFGRWLEGVAAQSTSAGLHVAILAGSGEHAQLIASLPRAVTPGLQTLGFSFLDDKGKSEEVDWFATAARTFGGHDLVVLAPGTRVPFAWDARLRKAAHGGNSVGVAMPMCDVHPLFALRNAEALSQTLPLSGAEVDRLAYCFGDRRYYEVPGVHFALAYFRAAALAEAGISDWTGDGESLPARLRSHGWACVVCDFLYVVSDGPRQPGIALIDEFETRAFVEAHPLGGLQREVATALQSGFVPASAPGLDALPVHLHVTHAQGGGVSKWVEDYARADTRCVNMILGSIRIGETGGQRIVLFSDPFAKVPIRTWDLAHPIRSVAPISLEYRRILEQIVAEFCVDAILVSSLIGHSLDALTCPVRTVLVMHDYSPICQALNPQFEGTCKRCTRADLARCQSSNPLNSFFPDTPSDAWHAMRELFTARVVERRLTLVAPSASVKATLLELEPRLQDLPFHVVPHGIDTSSKPIPVPHRSRTDRLRLVVVGRLDLHKGLELLRESVGCLNELAEVTLLGCGKLGVALAESSGWRHVERYRAEELSGLLTALAPHTALHPSIVPESFSYTLSEVRALGIPSIASALGAFVDRIVEGETGFLFEPSAAGLETVLRKIYAEPALLSNVAQRLSTQVESRSCAAMVADYHRLLPSLPMPVARFRVGIGMQTALTEPYRHLRSSYEHLAGAYGRLHEAFIAVQAAQQHTSQAYLATKSELDALRFIIEDWKNGYDSTGPKGRWWRAVRALRFTQQMRIDLARLEAARAASGQDKSSQEPT